MRLDNNSPLTPRRNRRSSPALRLPALPRRLLAAAALVALGAFLVVGAPPAAQAQPAMKVNFSSDMEVAVERDEHGIRSSKLFYVVVDPPLESGGSSVLVRIKAGSTATQGADYSLFMPDAAGTTATKVLRLPHGEEVVDFGMTFRNDFMTEGVEQVTLELVPIENAPYVIGDRPEMTISIVDNSEPAPSDADLERGIDIRPRAATVQTGSTVSYNVSLTSRPTGDVTVRAYLDGLNGVRDLGSTGAGITGMTVSPASLTFTPTDWYRPQSFTVSPGDVEPGRHIIIHGLESDDLVYNTGGGFSGPGIIGRTHTVITVVAASGGNL